MPSLFSMTWCTPFQLSSLCRALMQGGTSCSADSFGTALVEGSQTRSVCSGTGAVPLCAAPNVFLALFVLLCFREPRHFLLWTALLTSLLSLGMGDAGRHCFVPQRCPQGGGLFLLLQTAP